MVAFSTEDIELDAEFAHLIPAPSADEYSQLETNLQEFGCLDPLICWGDILLDGHTRFKICCEHEIAFKVKRLRFADRNAARNWIINHQLGRRNITPETRKYLLGCLYAEERCDPTENIEKPAESSMGKSYPPERTSERIAAEHGVSEKTVRNAATFAKAVDEIAETAGDEVKEAILSREVKSTDADVKALAKLPPKKQQEAAEKITSGEAKSVAAAVEAVTTEPEEAVEQSDEERLKELQAPYKEAVAAINKIKRELGKLVKDEKLGAHLNPPWGRIAKALEDAKAPIAMATPAAIHSKCKGNGCNQCAKTGFLPKSVWDSLSEKERS